MEGHVSFLQIMSYSKVIWYIGKGFLGIYKIFGIFAKKIGLWQLPLYNALIKAPPVRQLMDFRNIHKIWIQKPSSNLLASMVC